MNIALIAYDFFPNQGGIAHVLNSFCKSFKDPRYNLYIFTKEHKSRRIFNLLDDTNYHFKSLISLFKKRKSIYYLFLSLWKLIKDTKTTFSDKIMIITYLLLKPKIFMTTLRNIQNIYPIFNKLNIDLIVGGDAGWYTIPLVIILSKIFQTKTVVMAYGNDFLIRNPLSLKSYFLRNFDTLILGTYKLKNLMKRIHHLPENKLRVINYGLILNEYEINITREELRKEFKISAENFILLSVGRHVARKKFDLVIKAIKLINERNPITDLKYYLIGQGETTQQLKKLVKSFDLEDDVFFLGYVNKLTRNKFFKLADVFVMPSVALKDSIEGFGIVFLEANYFKIPVIGSYSGGIVEAITDNKTGLLVKPNDLEDLIEKILFFYNNRYRKSKMGEMGHKRVIKKFNWDNLIREYYTVFEDVISDDY